LDAPLFLVIGVSCALALLGCGGPKVTPEEALQVAQEVLGEVYATPLPPVTVRPVDSWKLLGEQVDGAFWCDSSLDASCSIEVASDEGALVHELLHWYEQKTTGRHDANHKGWTEGGWDRLIYRYQNRIGVGHNRGY